jgi:hypothetical protein
LPRSAYEAIWRHLLGVKDAPEEVAFVFAKSSANGSRQSFDYLEWYAVPREGFAFRSKWHLELSDETKAGVIKRAHDLKSSLVEFHAHRGGWPARFSGSDWLGFEEFVPHVLWRLKGRPYAAVVVTASGFDGLTWTELVDDPARLTDLSVDGETLKPTGLSPLGRDGYEFSDE